MKYKFFILFSILIAALNINASNIYTQKQSLSDFKSDDTIVLKNGTIFLGNVEEISAEEIKYRRNENINGPLIVLKTKEVEKIIYSNGVVDDFSGNTLGSIYTGRKLDTFAALSFFIAVVGFFVASIPLGTIATIFGLIGLIRIFKKPMVLKGKGFAILGILLGITEFLLVLSML